jgi:hypothetical protein
MPQIQCIEKQISSLLSKVKHQPENNRTLINLRRHRDRLLKGIDDDLGADEAFQSEIPKSGQSEIPESGKYRCGEGTSKNLGPCATNAQANSFGTADCTGSKELVWRPHTSGSPSLKEELVAVRVILGGR